MRYRVNLLRRATNDARSMFDWIAERSKTGANGWIRALDAAILRLEQNPLGCGRAEESDVFQDRDLRQIFFKTPHGRLYRAVFVVMGDQVQVLRIRGSGQQLLTPDDL